MRLSPVSGGLIATRRDPARPALRDSGPFRKVRRSAAPGNHPPAQGFQKVVPWRQMTPAVDSTAQRHRNGPARRLVRLDRGGGFDNHESLNPARTTPQDPPM